MSTSAIMFEKKNGGLPLNEPVNIFIYLSIVLYKFEYVIMNCIATVHRIMIISTTITIQIQ